MANDCDCLISVDVECSGPIPGDYSLLSLGACVVGRREDTFYAEFQPLHDHAVPEAMRVTGFDLAQLRTTGQRPQQAMTSFQDWVRRVSGAVKPVFVGFNAGFDWSFVNWYFHHFVGENPFGPAPLDIKSYYMGRSGCRWEDTRSSRLPAEFQPSKPGTHHALADLIRKDLQLAPPSVVTRFQTPLSRVDLGQILHLWRAWLAASKPKRWLAETSF